MTKSAGSVMVLGGAGAMGARVARTLVGFGEVSKLVVADVDARAAATLAAELGASHKGKVGAQQADVTDAVRLRRLLDPFQLVVNCTGPFFRFALPVLQAAIDAHTDSLDICDDPEPTSAMLALDAAAAAAGITAVVGMGASPGVSNLCARLVADRLDQVIDIWTAWPLDIAAPGHDEAIIGEVATSEGRPSAAAVHLMEQISGRIGVIRDGRVTEERPLRPIALDYPGKGRGTAYTVGHPEPITLADSVGPAGNGACLMLAQPATIAFLRSLRRRIDRGRMTLEQAAAALLEPARFARLSAAVRALLYASHGELPAFFVLATGTRDGRRLSVGASLTATPPGMDGATGIPAALGAREMLRGRVARRGVLPPELAFDVGEMLRGLLPYCSPTVSRVEDLVRIDESSPSD